VFYVNWFRKGDDGSFLWPGFGENSRVLEWIFRRCEDAVDAVDTPIGLVPRLQDLNTKGLELPPEALEALLTVDADLAAAELPQTREHLDRFGDRLPQTLRDELVALEQRLSA
jgi:phosphoenolpyruvate carboxykinase (GTP)